MSATRSYRARQATTDKNTQDRPVSEAIGRAIHQIKDAMLFEHLNQAGEHGRLLRLALNEAEALAWQTEYPQLMFPELAREKAQAALSWHERQRSLRRAVTEVAFAE